MPLLHGLRLMLFVGAAFAIASCRWTSTEWIIPEDGLEWSPTPAGVYYISTRGSTHTISIDANGVTRFTVHSLTEGGPDTTYDVSFDRIEGDYYIAEVSRDQFGVAYIIYRARAGGYDYWQPGCAQGVDQQMALSAGAQMVTSHDDQDSVDCNFTSYTSLMQAARAVVTAIRAGTYSGSMVSFSRN